MNRRWVWLVCAACLAATVRGAEPESKSPNKRASGDKSAERKLVRMPDNDVWIDLARHQVVLQGQVCLREGQLEMLICPKGTKEHESVLSIDARAFVVHAALLRVGAKPGQPAQWRPEYRPAEGPEVRVWLFWTDAEGKRQHARGQEWVRKMGTDDVLEQPWVFGGSGFWKDPATGEERYQAEGGDLVCVSNFSTAMMDLPVESSDDAGSLLFEAYADRIPPMGSKVTIVLAPVLEQDSDSKKSEDDSKEEIPEDADPGELVRESAVDKP